MAGGRFRVPQPNACTSRRNCGLLIPDFSSLSPPASAFSGPSRSPEAPIHPLTFPLGQARLAFLKPLPMARSPFPRPSLWPSRPTQGHVSHISRVKSLKNDDANRENGHGLTCDMLMVPVARVLKPRIVRFLYRFRRWSMMWSWLPSRLRKWGYWNGNQESHN